MAFTLSGSTITQTGTDTNLSGLSGIAGVTTEQTTTDGTHTVYNLGSLRLDIQGTLTIDPAIECLYSDNNPGAGGSVRVFTTGTLNLGIKQTSGSKVKYSTGTLMYFSDFGGSIFSNPHFLVDGGTLNWFGGTIYHRSPIIVKGGANFNVERGVLYNTHTSTVQFRFESAGAAEDSLFNVTGLILDGDSPISFFTLSGFNTFSPILLNGGFQTFTSPQPDQLFVDWNNENNFSSQDILGNSLGTNNSKGIYRNAVNDITVAQQAADRDAYFRQERAVSISPIESDGTSVLEFSYYGVDTDNGSRFTSYTGEDNTADLVYSGSETDGQLDLNIVKRIGQVFNGTVTYDNRINAQGTIPIRLIGYNYNPATVNPVLNGLGAFEQSPFFLIDNLITEQDKSITDTYTTLETPEKFYNRAKSFLVDNYAGETDTIVTRTGDTITTIYDVELRSGGANAFEFDGTTISIRVGTQFTGNITTTGTVTFQGNPTINGSIIDSNGDSFLTFNGVDSWTVYANSNDRDSNTNALETGTGIYRFNFVVSTTYYLRLVVNGETLFKEVTPTQSGETIVDLTVTGLLSTSATKEQIAEQVWSDTETYTGTQKGKLLADARNKANLAASLSG